MQKFDILILKRNINSLLKNKGVTQQQLADVLGMSQSNVSKALSENHIDDPEERIAIRIVKGDEE